MQKCLSYVFVWVVVLNAMSLSIVQLSFELNRDYIAEFLCVERKKEITVCRGACFLKDKLKEAESQQDQNQLSNVVVAVFFMPTYWENVFLTPEQPSITYSSFQELLNDTLFSGFFFHPPRA